VLLRYVNGRLKDEFGGSEVRVRGHAKVFSHLMFGILVVTVDQLMRFVKNFEKITLVRVGTGTSKNSRFYKLELN